MITASTALFQAPQHQALSSGFDREVFEFLLNTYWIRTAAWSLYALLDLYLLLLLRARLKPQLPVCAQG